MKNLHVISFDVPYPANYGGVIVVYNQLLAWKALGVKVILHAYQYGDRPQQKHLDEVCEKVHYYKRATGWKSSMSAVPYIVNSRKSDALMSRLLKDDYPIFFEGVHTSAWIQDDRIKDRLKILRMHNIEWQYYTSLHALEANPLRKYYFYLESRRLKKYDAHAIAHTDVLLTISEKDQAHYHSQHKYCHLMPAPHSETFDVKTGKGTYFLYHGKLSVEDNKKAALHLMKNVFSKTDAKLIVAGLDPDKTLIEAVAKQANVSLQANLTADEMKALIQNAQANILYTYQDSGLKLKLLHAVHLGRHCIVNDLMVSNASDLALLCDVGADNQEIIDHVERLKEVSFTESMKTKRQSGLGKRYDNLENTKILLVYMKKYSFT